MTKSCSKCKVLLPFSDFSPNKRSKSGFTSWCRPCISKYNKGSKNREKAKLRNVRYRDRKRAPEKQARIDEINAVASGLSVSISCFKCKVVKPLSDFSKDPRKTTGHLSWCRRCSNEIRNELNRSRSKNRIIITGGDCAKRKRHARIKIGNAIAMGLLIKEPCMVCGSLTVHAHHTDYHKPLQIEWLCPQHHNDKHWS